MRTCIGLNLSSIIFIDLNNPSGEKIAATTTTIYLVYAYENNNGEIKANEIKNGRYGLTSKNFKLLNKYIRVIIGKKENGPIDDVKAITNFKKVVKKVSSA
jgi:hypothetical protein